jgi:probable rRNA maturation factor
LRVLLLNQTSRKFSAKRLQKFVDAIVKVLKNKTLAKKELTVVFVTPKQMQKLNREHRSKDYVTDVLSFAALEEGQLGELVICLQKIQSQAKEHSLSFEEELLYMLLHGILHLLGYEHETNATDAKKMFALQDASFNTLCGLLFQKS